MNETQLAQQSIAQTLANSAFFAHIREKLFSGSLKKWLGGMVNNPTTGVLSHDKVWAHVAAGVMTYQFATGTPAEWQWWAYGGMVGGYGLAQRAIAAVQQTSEKKEK